MKKITLHEERREVSETELASWLDVAVGYRLDAAALIERRDARGVSIVFKRHIEHVTIGIETSRVLDADAAAQVKLYDAERAHRVTYKTLRDLVAAVSLLVSSAPSIDPLVLLADPVWKSARALVREREG